ncbi:hypothetical protein V2J09_006683 [Rumex salicifolius]
MGCDPNALFPPNAATPLSEQKNPTMEITPAAGSFELPDGWVLEVRPRGNSKGADKYYYEPHTGRQFRSLSSIKRYLDGEDEPTRRRKAPKTHQEGDLDLGATPGRIAHNGKVRRPERAVVVRQEELRENVGQRATSTLLPDGWIVKRVPRRGGFKTDNYYIEPLTRREFRSVPEVQRYLTADDEFAAKYKSLEMINSTVPPMNPYSGKGNLSTVLPESVKPQKSISDMSKPPPDKITWILSITSSNNNPDGHEKWIPFMESSVIPDYVSHLWEETFFFGMTGTNAS